ncbi:MAG: hypothetical protein IJY20_01400 [Clostridia bacterium]|nr:hypothetical protein [Clostridia bacterium]
MKKVLLTLLLLSVCLLACAPSGAGDVTYTVTVLDADGHAAVGVSLQLCKDEACLMPKTTDANGQMTFTLEAGEQIGDYHLTLSNLPEGNVAEAAYRFAPGTTTLEIRLAK